MCLETEVVTCSSRRCMRFWTCNMPVSRVAGQVKWTVFISWLNIYKWFTGQVLNNEGEETNHMKCIAVNPGRLAKGEGGGTFVELDYSGGPDKINASILAIWMFSLASCFWDSGTFVISMS